MASAKKIAIKFNELGIKYVAWDLDGTIVDTSRLFDITLKDAAGLLKYGEKWDREKYGEEAEKFRAEIGEIIWNLRHEFGVNPVIMSLSVEIAGRQVLGLTENSENLRLAHERIRQHYEEDVPEIFDGALDTIDLLNGSGISPLLMTHAEELWTIHKRERAGLVGKFERTVCFSVDMPKSAQWKTEFEKLKLDPTSALVIGDNLNADILPTLELGARAIWIDRKREVYSGEAANSENKTEVIGVGDIRDIPRAILEKLN